MKKAISKDDVLDLENKESLWDIKFLNFPVWDYFRADLTNQHLPFKGNIFIGGKDFIYFLKFFLLAPLFKKDCIFICGRNDTIEYAKNISKEFGLLSPYIFIRQENSNILGNSFFIEVVRYLFRKMSYLFFLGEYRRIRNELNSSVDIDSKKIKTVIGDVLFNKLCGKLLKGKVIFSNCVIPRSERYLRCMDSYEVQHGVIHEEHPDYYEMKCNRARLIVKDKLTIDVLSRIGFSGKLYLCEPDLDIKEIEFKFIIFTTVNSVYSEKVNEFCLLNSNVIIQPHPKDEFKYDNNIKKKYGISPRQVEIIVLPDSSLISECIKYNVFFYLFDPESRTTKEQICIKYGEFDNFKIINALDEVNYDI